MEAKSRADGVIVERGGHALPIELDAYFHARFVLTGRRVLRRLPERKLRHQRARDDSSKGHSNA